MLELNGFPVDVMPIRVGPARIHAKRRNGGKRSYHERIQKKWVRRFGVADQTPLEPGNVYMIRDPLTGRQRVVVRSDDMPRIRAMLSEGE